MNFAQFWFIASKLAQQSLHSDATGLKDFQHIRLSIYHHH